MALPGIVGQIAEKGADMLNSVYRVSHTAVDAVSYVPRAPEVAWRLFRMADLNHDGKLTVDEFEFALGEAKTEAEAAANKKVRATCTRVRAFASRGQLCVVSFVARPTSSLLRRILRRAASI